MLTATPVPVPPYTGVTGGESSFGVTPWIKVGILPNRHKMRTGGLMREVRSAGISISQMSRKRERSSSPSTDTSTIRTVGKTCSHCNAAKRSCDRKSPCDRCIAQRCADSCVDYIPKPAKLRGTGHIVKKACNHCRRSKTKCDQVRPCSRCTRLGTECSDFDHAKGYYIGNIYQATVEHHMAKKHRSNDVCIATELSSYMNPFRLVVHTLSRLAPPIGLPFAIGGKVHSDEYLNSLTFDELKGLDPPFVMSAQLVDNPNGIWKSWKFVRTLSKRTIEFFNFPDSYITNVLYNDEAPVSMATMFPIYFDTNFRNIMSWSGKVNILKTVLTAVYYPGKEISGFVAMKPYNRDLVPVKFVAKVNLNSQGYMKDLFFGFSVLPQ